MERDSHLSYDPANAKQLTFDIPVIIDDVKNYRNFSMTRCTYFTIECDVPSPNWILGLENKSIPFVLIGLSGVVFKPIGDSALFPSAESIEELFNTIETSPSLYIDTNDLWLPNVLFQTPQRRGQVYRVGNRLFNEAYLFREEKISEDYFLRRCSHLKPEIRHSEKETLSFENWGKSEIEKAKGLYPKNKNLELRYR